MVEKLTYIESESRNPYRNLAVEEYLLLHCEDRECILYLWQNQHTVVIGRNQNAWKECLLTKLDEEGGHLARRLSGGGAVYHDLGNLNFTFLVRKGNYSVEKQLAVIIRALEMLGIHAVKSGRNDVLVDGRKISGNAFYEQGDHCYHHGTLMVQVDMNDLSRYLTVSKDKLKSKGVNSVKSRVANLIEFSPEITIEGLKEALRKAFEEVYGHKLGFINWKDLPEEEVQAGENKFSSWEWLYGRKLDFQYELETRFGWGNFNLQFQVGSGKVQAVNVYSDSLRPEFVEIFPECFCNVRYEKKELVAAVREKGAKKVQERFGGGEDETEMLEDICKWLEAAEL